MVKLTINDHRITNAGGSLVAIVNENRVWILQEDFARCVRQIRAMLGNSIHFMVM